MDRDRPAACLADGGDRGRGVLGRRALVDDHVVAAPGERYRTGAADASAGAGDQGRGSLAHAEASLALSSSRAMIVRWICLVPS